MPPKPTFARIPKRALSFAVGVCLLAACSKPDPNANLGPKMAGKDGKKPATPTSAPAPATVASAKTIGRPSEFLSLFSTNDPRDPFHPKSRPKTAPTAQETKAAIESEVGAVEKAVQAGFSQIISFGESKILVLFGQLLEEGKEKTFTVNVSGNPRKMRIKAMKILRNTAELKIEGIPQVVSVTKAQR